MSAKKPQPNVMNASSRAAAVSIRAWTRSLAVNCFFAELAKRQAFQAGQNSASTEAPAIAKITSHTNMETPSCPKAPWTNLVVNTAAKVQTNANKMAPIAKRSARWCRDGATVFVAPLVFVLPDTV